MAAKREDLGRTTAEIDRRYRAQLRSGGRPTRPGRGPRPRQTLTADDITAVLALADQVAARRPMPATAQAPVASSPRTSVGELFGPGNPITEMVLGKIEARRWSNLSGPEMQREALRIAASYPDQYGLSRLGAELKQQHPGAPDLTGALPMPERWRLSTTAERATLAAGMAVVAGLVGAGFAASPGWAAAATAAYIAPGFKAGPSGLSEAVNAWRGPRR